MAKKPLNIITQGHNDAQKYSDTIKLHEEQEVNDLLRYEGSLAAKSKCRGTCIGRKRLEIVGRVKL